MNTISLCLN